MRTGLVRGVVIGVIVALIVIVGLIVGVFGWAHASGEDLQKDFFAAVLSGDPNRVTALMDPALVREFDEPILAKWMDVVKDNLGPVKGLSKTDFNTSSEITAQGRFTVTKGTVEFEKGTATSELKYKDGKLTAFHIQSDRVPDESFQGVPTGRTALYRQRGEKFLRLFLEGQADAAFAMMHENLQKIVPMEKLKAMMADTAAKAGAVKALAYKSESVEPSGKLKIVYELDAEKTSGPVSVKFEFVGMKGHLLAFDFTGKDE